MQAAQSAKIAKVSRRAGPMLNFVAAGEELTANQHGGVFPGGTIVRATAEVRPDFLISWHRDLTACLLAVRGRVAAGLGRLSGNRHFRRAKLLLSRVYARIR